MKNFFKKSKDKSDKSDTISGPSSTPSSKEAPSSRPSDVGTSSPTTLPSSAPRHKEPDSDYSSGEELDEVKSLQPSSKNYKSSLFSTPNTFSTNQSSLDTSGTGGGFGFKPSQIDNIGKPLRVINSDRYNELSRTGTGSSSVHSSNTSLFAKKGKTENEDITIEYIENEILILNEDLLELNEQVNQNILNISKASIKLIELFDNFIPHLSSIKYCLSFQHNMNLRNILKVFLQFYDSLLRSQVYANSRRLIIQSFNNFLTRLNFKTANSDYQSYQTLPYINNFAITSECKLSNKKQLETIISTIVTSATNQMIQDQEGSFIAPILRGFSKQTAILSIMFGFPEPQLDHYEIINALFELFPDVHFFVVKNSIQPCGYKFNQPFKLPNLAKPEISISISSESSEKISGTLGGYIKPIFTEKPNEKLYNKFKDSKFGLTCGHVLLNSTKDLNSKVYIPSKVLVTAYRSALIDQRDKYPVESIEYKSYDLEIQKPFETELGSIIWGERTLVDKQISDLSIVKINGAKFSDISSNYLGDLEQYNPSLKFKNTYITKRIAKADFHKNYKIFKVGSSTNYTVGELNELKLIYWNGGNLQTSEFVVSNLNKNAIFANFGDSGSLILNDLPNEIGLGCLGMLHSFDGEFKQFGLFTPIEDIFERLKGVTGIEWDFVYEDRD
ncbi:hypothetical protein WICPIJ_007247 [Wickerhamomyces pijperi]|uniref:SPS-sensor serine protease component SSY5 n=1 Tax=Wickerhamomyces pijperi TaxID=599730 RepID=A0A9P8Q0A9_WICPI|nr:hypothetical protein WICPIJ_007247 [Wickerhamomyces pijperi]